jgi:hypothetical protein
MNTYGKTLSGKFEPINPGKYLGNSRTITYRSSWEKKFMVWADRNPSVIAWANEEIVVWYFNPVKKRKARYFPDFVIKIRNTAGKIKVIMIEVKPELRCSPPIRHKSGKITRSFVASTLEWEINKAKWAAAEEYCKLHGMEFKLVTEKHLNIKKY